MVPGALSYRLEVSNDANFPLGNLPAGIQTFWFDNIPAATMTYVHTAEGNWFARVFALDAANSQDGVRSWPSNVIQFSVFYNNPIGPAPLLVGPVNNPTLTLPVTLTWAHVPNPQPSGYFLQVAKDSTFSTIEWTFNQYTEPSTEMLSLTAGPKFWRVLSQQGLSSPTTNANTAWSATGRFTISSAPATPVSIAPLGNPSMFLYSGDTAMVALQLTAAVPAGGATIALASSQPTLAPLPPTIFMAGNSAWAQFPMTVGQVTSATPVTLSATLNGVTVANQFTLQPPSLKSLAISSPFVNGGAQAAGTLSLNGLAPAAGAVVSLSSDSPLVSVPAVVTIPAGAASSGLTVATSLVAADTPVTISATWKGVSVQSQLTLTPLPPPTSLTVRPMSTTNGAQGIATVAPGVGYEQILQATSSNPAVASVSNFVTAAAVSGLAYFDIATAPVSLPTPVTISLSGGGVTLTHPLTVYPSLPKLTSIAVSPTSVVGGAPASGTVTLASPAPAGGVAINLASNQPLAAAVPPSVTVPGGASSANFTVTTFPHDTTTVQLSAALDNVFQFTFPSLSVTAAPTAPTLASLSLNPTSVVGGNASTATVTLSAPAPSGGQVVMLSDDANAVSVPASVTIAAGATSRTFTVSTSAVANSTAANVTAISAGVSRTAMLTVNPPAPAAPSLLGPANGATVAQPVTLDWNDVAGAMSYEIQVDDSSTIAAPFIVNQIVTASQVTLSGLPAQRLWWRVRARNSSGVAGPFSSVRSLTVQAAATTSASLSAVSVSPASVVGPTASTGTVTLTAAAPSGGAVVALASSNPSVANVPASVTVPAGATSASFSVSTSAVAAATSATITALYAGVTRTAALTVNPAGASLTLTVTASGRGGELIVSRPAGINVTVGATGSASFAANTAITLSVASGRSALWSGACSSGGNKTQSCTFTITANAAVTANVQ